MHDLSSGRPHPRTWWFPLSARARVCAVDGWRSRQHAGLRLPFLDARIAADETVLFARWASVCRGGRARWWARPRVRGAPLHRHTGRDRGTRALCGRTDDVVRPAFTPRWHSRPERRRGTAHDNNNDNGTRPEAVSYARAGRTGRSQQYA